MRIVFLTDFFPPDAPGGAGVVAFNLAKGLLAEGHDVSVITTTQNKLRQGPNVVAGIKVWRIRAGYHERWRAYLSLYNPQTVKKVTGILRQLKPDVVHVHTIHFYLSYHCLKAARKFSRAVFLTAHDVMLVHYGKWMPRHRDDMKISVWDNMKLAKKRYNPVRNPAIKRCLKHVDQIFTVSDSLRHLLAVNGINNLTTVHNSLNIDDFSVSGDAVERFKKKHNLMDKKVILFAGRLSQAKGGETAVRILGRIDGAVLLVLGRQGEYLRKMNALAGHLGAAQRLVCAGWAEKDELKAAYHACDVCLAPSLCFDTFGMVCLEAMACRKPVVGSCFGGMAEIIADGQTGYVVNPYHVDAAAAKVAELLTDTEKARHFSEAGFVRAKEKFSLKRQVAATLKWYKRYV